MLQLSNFGRATLNSPPTGIAGLSFTVAVGMGARFPTLAAGDYAYGIFTNSSKSAYEIVRISARSGDSFTIATGSRGSEGTTAATWATGDVFYLANTVAALADILRDATNFAVASAGGSADALTASFSNLTTLTDKMRVRVVAASANATATPSLNPNGLGAQTIVRNGGAAMVAGDIKGAGYVCDLQYDLANTRWLMLNPYTATFNNANALTCYYLPSANDGWRGLFRAGFWHWNFNQAWGGPWGGELVDTLTGVLRKVECHTGQILRGAGYVFGDANVEVYTSQGFKVSATGSYTAIWVPLYKVGSPSGSVTMSIYSDNGSGKPNALIATATTLVPGKSIGSEGAGQWFRFVFPATSLTAGTQYHYLVNSTAAVDASNYFVMAGYVSTTVNPYPHGFINVGTNVPAWTSFPLRTAAFIVEPASGAAMIQSGGQHDGKLVGNEGSPLNQSSASCSQVRLADIVETAEHTGYIVGTALTKDKTIADIGWAIDHDRIVLRANPTTGYAQIDVMDSANVKRTVTAAAVDLSSGTHSVGWYVRAKGDGADRIDLFVDGTTYSSTGLSITFSEELRQGGTMWVGGGFGLPPTWSGSSIPFKGFSALPSGLGWTFSGTLAASEGSCMSVANGLLFQNRNFYGATDSGYYRKASIGFVNGTGLALAAEVRNAYNPVTSVNPSVFANLSDGTWTNYHYWHELYQAMGTGSQQRLFQRDGRTMMVSSLTTQKGTDFLTFQNMRLIVDGTGLLTLSAAGDNAINFGDGSTTSSENSDAVYGGMRYYTGGQVAPQFTGGSISEFAVWAGDRKALWPSLYNGGAFVSVKSFCGMSENYLRRAWPDTFRKGITPSPSTSTSSHTTLAEMEAFVVGDEVDSYFDGDLYNTALANNTAVTPFVDGYWDGVYNTNLVSKVANYQEQFTARERKFLPFGLHKSEFKFNCNGGTSFSYGTRRAMTVRAAG